MGETVLTKGANCELPSQVTSVRVSVAWDEPEGVVDVDAAALLLDGSGRVRSDDDLVFFNQPASQDGSVHLLGRTVSDDGANARIAIDLASLDPDVQTVAVTASLSEGTFGALSGLVLQARDQAGESLALFEITDATTETAFVFCEIYRRGPGWKVRAVGQGWDTGLSGLATDFGVSVDDQPVHRAPVPAPGSDDTLTIDEVVHEDAEPDVEIREPAVVDAIATVVEFPAMESPVASSTPERRAGVRTTKRAAAPVAPPVLKLAGAPTWQAARLFSISGVGTAEEQEKRATSALLATMMAVPAFGRALTARFGAPAGNVETYLEVAHTLGETTLYPDGVLRVSRAGRMWTALLEVKTGSGELRRDQVERYLDVARRQGYDSLITLSNEIAAHAGEHPVADVDKRKLRIVTLQHLSWAEVLHEAKFTLHHRGVGDPLQAWILCELVRYLEHSRSGAETFDDMGAAWVPVRQAIQAGTLRAGDRKVPAVADAWTRLVRHMCLRLSSELGVTVTQSVPRKLATESAARIQAIATKLAGDGLLEAVLKVPLAAGLVALTADLRTSQVRVSVALVAPQEGTGQRRISWLLRQLREAPDALLVEALFTGRAETSCERLGEVRSNPTALLPDRGAEIAEFRLTLVSPMGTKRSGVRGGFVPSVVGGVENFYSSVVQPLKAWQRAAPMLPEASAVDAHASDVNAKGIDEALDHSAG
ncbi:TerD family protein [Cellulomonas sp. URHD0024]|uniref:TerD family protein n=1 Tax=Cellulomonas sp. URHD0024 TaxID=1302620 RepID=UPI00048332E6|nr:TerD family protein [Cellulomonas sp. URHD0024]